MTTDEMVQVTAGRHWLNKLAEELGRDAMTDIRELGAQDWTPSEIAIAIVEAAQPREVTMGSKIHITCYPWEKSKIVRAAQGEKLNEWVRRALIEKAMTE